MNNFEKYLTRLLQGNLSFDTQVVKQFSQSPHLPVITLDISGGVVTDEFIEYDINEDNIAFKKYTRKSYININVWCNKEEERQKLCDEIMSLFMKEQSYHPMFCTYYTEGMCNYSGDKCVTLPNRGGVTCICGLEDYEEIYKPLYVDCNIYNGSLNIEPPFDLDELTENPPLLHSIMKAECEYYDIVNHDTLN